MDESTAQWQRINAGMYSKSQNCLSCGEEYDAKYLAVSEQPIDLSTGLCYKCREEKEKDRIATEDRLTATESQNLREKMRKGCGIPDKFLTATFQAFQTDREGNLKSVRTICKRYADNFPIEYLKYKKEKNESYPSLILASVNVWGVGKTHLACSICHRILDRWNGERTGCPVLFVTEPDIYNRLQATFNYNPEERHTRPTYEEIMRELIYTPLLIIDDVGKVPRQDQRFVQRTMFEIVDARYKNLRPIVMTTNKSAEGLESYLGNQSDQATFDRLYEMVGGLKEGYLMIKAESYRRK